MQTMYGVLKEKGTPFPSSFTAFHRLECCCNGRIWRNHNGPYIEDGGATKLKEGS